MPGKNKNDTDKEYVVPGSIPGEIPVDRVYPNPEQPRRRFSPGELQELADSIKVHGVIQPISVEQVGEDYILHSGERRLRAARMAGKTTIPAMIMPALNGHGPAIRLERAIIENVQREDMGIVDEGLALLRLMTENKYSIRDISKKISKSEKWVSDRVYIAVADPEIRELMRFKMIPSLREVVVALNSIPNRSTRIKVANKFGENGSTAKAIVKACKEINNHITNESNHRTGGNRNYVRSKSTLAMDTVDYVRNGHMLNEWNALSSVGKVPPYPMLNDAVLMTCNACSIRYMASEATCGSCAMVIMLKQIVRIVEDTTHAEKPVAA